MDDSLILQIKDLRVEIPMPEGTLTPVRGVNFEMRKGETVGLVGESGCGKSLTCKAILGINDKKCKVYGEINYNHPTDGAQNLLAMNPRGKQIRSIRGKEISMIFQEPMVAFSPLYTIDNQISEAALLHITKNRQEAKELSIAMMKKVGIANAEKRYNQYPHEFSGGMLQRAMITMALVCHPKILIADEPTTALDVTIQAQILELMKEMQKDSDMGILFITHDLGVVARMCDRVNVMYLGKIVESGPAVTIYADPEHPYTNGLMHSVHKIGSRKKERLFSIEGTVPLAMNLKTACGFYERCDHRIEGLCDQADPELVEVAPDHKVACFACDNEACRAMRAKAEAMLKAQGQQGASKEEKRHE